LPPVLFPGCFPDKGGMTVPRCIIIGPMYAGEEAALLARREGDCILCADGGYRAAKACGVTPDLVVGDFDSMPRNMVGDVPVVELPVHKDDTDMVVCLQEGRERGYHTFLIAGALGGRFDHAIANVQCLADCALRGERAWLVDGLNRVTVLSPGEYVFPRMEGRKFSLLAWAGEVKQVTLTGTLWPLDGRDLSPRYPLGCSNEIIADEARLSFSEGLLLVALSRDALPDGPESVTVL